MDDLIDKSTEIVRARVLSASTAPRGQMVYTYYTVAVSEKWKGASAGQITVATPGGQYGGVEQHFAGSPQLTLGSEYILYLFTNRSHLTQIIGLSQGLFNIAKDSQGDELAQRPAITELLLDAQTHLPVSGQSVQWPVNALRARTQQRLAGAH